MKVKILVGTDGSRGARAALKFAEGLARSGGVSAVRIVHVATSRRDLMLGISGVPFALTALPDIERLEKRSAEKMLAAAASKLAAARVRIDTRYVPPQNILPVAETLAAEADRFRADLIVVGSEGRGAARELLLGNVPQRLVHVSRRPVAIVHPRRQRR